MGQERKVFIAYPATLKYLDEYGKENIVFTERRIQEDEKRNGKK